MAHDRSSRRALISPDRTGQRGAVNKSVQPVSPARCGERRPGGAAGRLSQAHALYQVTAPDGAPWVRLPFRRMQSMKVLRVLPARTNMPSRSGQSRRVPWRAGKRNRTLVSDGASARSFGGRRTGDETTRDAAKWLLRSSPYREKAGQRGRWARQGARQGRLRQRS